MNCFLSTKLMKNHRSQGNRCIIAVSAVLIGAKSSAGIVMIQYGYHIWTGPGCDIWRIFLSIVLWWLWYSLKQCLVDCCFIYKTTHILLGHFIVTGAIEWLHQCQWNYTGGHSNRPVSNMNKTKQVKTILFNSWSVRYYNKIREDSKIMTLHLYSRCGDPRASGCL